MDEYQQAFRDAAYCDLDAGWCDDSEDDVVQPAGIGVPPDLDE